MFIHFTFNNGSNPYIVKNNAELFRMVKKYIMDQTDSNSFYIYGEISYYMIHTGRKLTAREKGRAALRDFAQQWQASFGYFSYSWSDLCDWIGFFEEYGRKYGLLREFRENGIC